MTLDSWSARSEGVLLVDALFAPLADRLVAAVEEISDREIRFHAQWGQEASWNANDFVPIVFHELDGGALYAR